MEEQNFYIDQTDRQLRSARQRIAMLEMTLRTVVEVGREITDERLRVVLARAEAVLEGEQR